MTTCKNPKPERVCLCPADGHIERIAKLAASLPVNAEADAEIARLMAAQEGEERPIGAAPSGELEEDEFIDETGKLRTMHVDDDAWLDIGEGRLIPHRLLHQWAVQHPSPLGWPRALAYFERHATLQRIASEYTVAPPSPPAEPVPACCSECADGWAYEDSSDHDGHPCNCPRGQQVALNWDLDQLRRIFRDRTPEQVVGAIESAVAHWGEVQSRNLGRVLAGGSLNLIRDLGEIRRREKRETAEALARAENAEEARDIWQQSAQERKVLIDRATGALTDSGVAPTYPPEAGILALTKERDEALARVRELEGRK